MTVRFSAAVVPLTHALGAVPSQRREEVSSGLRADRPLRSLLGAFEWRWAESEPQP
jgi:hypothetical protein